jgi:hypothetical protein
MFNRVYRAKHTSRRTLPAVGSQTRIEDTS